MTTENSTKSFRTTLTLYPKSRKPFEHYENKHASHTARTWRMASTTRTFHPILHCQRHKSRSYLPMGKLRRRQYYAQAPGDINLHAPSTSSQPPARVTVSVRACHRDTTLAPIQQGNVVRTQTNSSKSPSLICPKTLESIGPI